MTASLLLSVEESCPCREIKFLFSNFSQFLIYFLKISYSVFIEIKMQFDEVQFFWIVTIHFGE